MRRKLTTGPRPHRSGVIFLTQKECPPSLPPGPVGGTIAAMITCSSWLCGIVLGVAVALAGCSGSSRAFHGPASSDALELPSIWLVDSAACPRAAQALLAPDC